MEEKESWGLTEKEIKQRLRQQNQENSKRGFTRGGRSSGQGVKLLYIRDNQVVEHFFNSFAGLSRLRSFLEQIEDLMPFSKMLEQA